MSTKILVRNNFYKNNRRMSAKTSYPKFSKKITSDTLTIPFFKEFK